MLLPAPNDMGLPDQYTQWRPHQDEAVMHVIDSQKPFVTHIAPTGFGKSLDYMAAALFSANRAIVLTATKGLQSQLMKDFEPMGLVDIRGRNAYKCRLEFDGTTCDHGACVAGKQCKFKESGCYYFDAVRRAVRAPFVVTNYAFWMSINKYGMGLGNFDLMICDEAHDLPDIVSNFLTFKLDKKDTYTDSILPTKQIGDYIHWKLWAKSVLPQVQDELSFAKHRVGGGEGSRNERRIVSKLLTLENTIKVLTNLQNDWVIDNGEKAIEFAPIWPREYAHNVLFLETPKVLLTSATVCEKTAQMVGVAQMDNDFKEFPHSFPVENRRLIHIPTIRLNRHTDHLDMRLWLTRIDQILRKRRDRKGVIHTVSYARRNLVVKSSVFKTDMVTHNTGEAVRMVSQFKKSPPPAYLVSPSMTTGWDFPGDECEFQIIGKLAYPDSRNKIVKARSKEDPDYLPYCAMQQLVQASGRGNRFAEDQCETFIIDDNIGWFLPKYSHFAPSWFHMAYKRTTAIPIAPKKLGGRNGR